MNKHKTVYVYKHHSFNLLFVQVFYSCSEHKTIEFFNYYSNKTINDSERRLMCEHRILYGSYKIV